MRLSALSVCEQSIRTLRSCRGASMGVLAAVEAQLRRAQLPGLQMQYVTLETGLVDGILDRTTDGLAIRSHRFPEHTFVVTAWSASTSVRDLMVARFVVATLRWRRVVRRIFTPDVRHNKIGAELSPIEEAELGHVLWAVDESVAAACSIVEQQLAEAADADETDLLNDEVD